MPVPLRMATLAAVIKNTPAPAVPTLVDLILKSLFLSRLKTAACAVSLVVMTAGLFLIPRVTQRIQPMRPADPGPTSSRAAPASSKPSLLDRFGDALPIHARARLGTVRFNAGEGVTHVLFAGEGRSLFTSGGRKGVQVWDIASGRVTRSTMMVTPRSRRRRTDGHSRSTR